MVIKSNIEYYQDNICNIKHEYGEFDVIIDSFCLQSIVLDHERKNVFSFVKKHLKKDGHYLIVSAGYPVRRHHTIEMLINELERSDFKILYSNIGEEWGALKVIAKEKHMNIHDHKYTNTPSDFEDVWNLLSALSSTQQNTWGWDFCRFELWYYRIHAAKQTTDPEFFARNLHLWRDESHQLRGIFLSEYGEKDIHVIVHPEFLELEERIFRWIEEEWVTDQPHLETSVPHHDARRQHLLTLLGYTRHGKEGYKYRYDLTTVPVEYTLESGFEIQALQADTDHEQKVALIRNAFNNPRFPRERYDSTMKAPSYTPSLDLSVVSPERRHVAYCMGWVNQTSKEGSIEPVGTHTDYRRRGFATALIKECFRRMKAMGVHSVIIGGDNQLYDSLQPIDKIPEDCWVKTG